MFFYVSKTFVFEVTASYTIDDKYLSHLFVKLLEMRYFFSRPIKSLLAEPAGIQKVYEDYTQLFIGPNSLHAPQCESVYLDRKL